MRYYLAVLCTRRGTGTGTEEFVVRVVFEVRIHCSVVRKVTDFCFSVGVAHRISYQSSLF